MGSSFCCFIIYIFYIFIYIFCCFIIYLLLKIYSFHWLLKQQNCSDATAMPQEKVAHVMEDVNQ